MGDIPFLDKRVTPINTISSVNCTPSVTLSKTFFPRNTDIIALTHIKCNLQVWRYQFH